MEKLNSLESHCYNSSHYNDHMAISLDYLVYFGSDMLDLICIVYVQFLLPWIVAKN